MIITPSVIPEGGTEPGLQIYPDVQKCSQPCNWVDCIFRLQIALGSQQSELPLYLLT